MEKFINKLFVSGVCYIQPQIWHTKGQTIKKYVDIDKSNVRRVLDTRSCWQSRFNVRFDGKFLQCGICSACLLRRMSLYVAGVEEDSEKYVVQNLNAKTFSSALIKNDKLRLTKSFATMGRISARQMQRLAILSELPDSEFYDHASEISGMVRTLGRFETTDTLQKKLWTMLKNNAIEWQYFKKIVVERVFSPHGLSNTK